MLRMKKKLLFIIIFLISWLDGSQEPFSCYRDVPSMPLHRDEIAGLWYEVVRFPKTDVLQCLNITVASKEKGPLDVGLKYVTVFDKERKAHEENITFPWDKYTENSIFILKYGNVFVTYKVLRASTDLVVLCGYSFFSPIPLLKGLSRQPKLTPDIKSEIVEPLERLNVTDFVYWTEQSPSKCSSSVCLVASCALSILPMYIKFLDFVNICTFQ